MYHRLDRHVFRRTGSNAGKFLMLCCLRKALRKTDQFRDNASGIIVCVVDKEWLWAAKSAATLLMSGGVRSPYDDDYRRQVNVLEEASCRAPRKGSEDLAVYRPEHQVMYLARSIEDVPQELQLAADVIAHVQAPTAKHIIAARKMLGVEDIEVSLAEAIARHQKEIVVGLTARRSLKGLDLAALSEAPVAPQRGAKFSDLPGYAAAREWVGAISRDVADWRSDKVTWSDVDKGVLLVGPPGTGKTLFATALANELEFDLITTSVGVWQGSGKGHLGDMLAAMSASFAEAASRRGAVLLVDELDAIGDRAAMRGDHIFYEGNVIGRFLDLTTQALEQPGTIIVGATNYGHLIDSAILRSGRLEKHVHLDLPDDEERAEILAYHLNGSLSATSLREVTDRLRLATPADLEKVARAAKRAARIRRGSVCMQDVELCLPAKVLLPEAVVHRICVHEVGHAILTMASGVADGIVIRVESHMVEGQSVQDGGRAQYKIRDAALPTETDLLARIRVMLGGTAAEEVVFGSRSIGAGGVEGSDLHQATRLAYRLVGSYGLGKWLRYQVNADRVDESFIPTPEMRVEVDGILAREYRATKDLLTKEKARLMRLAAELCVDRQMTIGKA